MIKEESRCQRKVKEVETDQGELKTVRPTPAAVEVLKRPSCNNTIQRIETSSGHRATTLNLIICWFKTDFPSENRQDNGQEQRDPIAAIIRHNHAQYGCGSIGHAGAKVVYGSFQLGSCCWRCRIGFLI